MHTYIVRTLKIKFDPNWSVQTARANQIHKQIFQDRVTFDLPVSISGCLAIACLRNCSIIKFVQSILTNDLKYEIANQNYITFSLLLKEKCWHYRFFHSIIFCLKNFEISKKCFSNYKYIIQCNTTNI